jgi:hypothetical protein
MACVRAPLIGVTGKKRSGKDTFAEALVRERGFTRVAFADPLRDSIYETNPLLTLETYLPGDARPYRNIRLADYVDTFGWHDAKDNPEVRRLLQAHGVAMRKHADPDVWVNAAMRTARPILEGGGGVVITDVRFPNEAARIKTRWGLLVRVTRADLPDPPDQHISETALDDWNVDIEVENNGTITELQARALQLVDGLR